MCFALFADNKYSKDQKNEEETTSKNWNSLNLLPCCIKKITVIFMVGDIALLFFKSHCWGHQLNSFIVMAQQPYQKLPQTT